MAIFLGPWVPEVLTSGTLVAGANFPVSISLFPQTYIEPLEGFPNVLTIKIPAQILFVIARKKNRSRKFIVDF